MLERERRKHTRRTVRYKAWIDVSADEMIDCELVDISEGGAKVQVNDRAQVPNHFVLLLSRQGSPQRPCRVVWRDEQHIGVQFAAITPSEPSNTLIVL